MLILLYILPLFPFYKSESPVPPLWPVIVLNQRLYHDSFGTQHCNTSMDSLAACCGLQCVRLPCVRHSGRG